ncbi:cytochrome c nitrite reductase small subunit [Nigerium massiliense]|uniref:cytochrome c nitrite reductase small subunit n=1 Tax=Nigerium massiliense TaxID=1522317 RepID=UPI000907988A|nr:cytochrome c nitrite reductase small subunit [Nigerium massiliense]
MMSEERTSAPPRKPAGFWAGTAFPVTVAVLFGVLVGLGIFTFGYAGGAAYFGEDPDTCVQCHSMKENFDSWNKGGHHHVATCQDCHSPVRDEEPVAWLLSEADNGFWHSLKFTTGWYPENIKIRDHNLAITERACLRCHGALTDDIRGTRAHTDQKISCTKCHANVGHER